jgi:hypothetical protein
MQLGAESILARSGMNSERLCSRKGIFIAKMIRFTGNAREL